MAKGKGPMRIVEVPDTWLGGCLRQDAGRTDWAGVIKVLSDVGAAFPDLGEFALYAANVTGSDPGATAEEVLKALNDARGDRNETLMDVLHLIGMVHQACASINRIKCEGVLSNWEERVAGALCESAANVEGGMASVQDRKTFFQMRGLLKPVGASVNIDARRMAPKADLAGAPAVEAGNVAFQALLDGSTDQPDEDE